MLPRHVLRDIRIADIITIAENSHLSFEQAEQVYNFQNKLEFEEDIKNESLRTNR